MKLTIPSFDNGAPIPAEFAMGGHAADAPATFGPNRSPHTVSYTHLDVYKRQGRRSWPATTATRRPRPRRCA